MVFQTLIQIWNWIQSLFQTLIQTLIQIWNWIQSPFQIQIWNWIQSPIQFLLNPLIQIWKCIRHLLPISAQFHILNTLPFFWSSVILGLRYKVECYGEGNVHKDLLMGGHSRNPCVLVVYKVSRETEDLRNALKWVQTNQGVQREDICTVILLEKVSNTHARPVEVDHQGVFDDRTMVVRILWENHPFSLRCCDRVQKGPRYKKAMEKVIQSISATQCN
ncbi:uncharacterized protein LOC144508359 [Mustelus asterias]